MTHTATETHDELAGVVDLFGGLTREELVRALTELAFKQGEEPDEDAVRTTVADAIDAYAIVAVERGAGGADEYEATDAGEHETANTASDGEPPDELLVPGPTAFPSLPPDADDLPHIMDVERRTVDRAAVGEQVLDRLRREAARAVDDGDEDRIEHLLDVSYDIETWAPVEAGEIRDRLDVALEE